MKRTGYDAVWRLLPWSLLFVLFVLLPALPASAGGWATFVLMEVPDYPGAGEAIDLTFIARGHGKAPFHFAKGEAKFVFRHTQTGETVDAAVTPVSKYVGTHTASVVLPRPGEWAWELRPGRYPILKLQPLTVLPGAEESLILRGKALFAAKGCVTCHRNDQMDDQWTVEIGPNLTDYANTSAFLHAWLANPASVKPGTQMPSPGLRSDEIDALAAFLLQDSTAVAHR